MNYRPNHKLTQITRSTLVIGIDIAKDKHVARAQDDRGYEFGKRLIFENRIHGFQQLLDWIFRLQNENGKDHVIIGAEHTKTRAKGQETTEKSSCIKMNSFKKHYLKILLFPMYKWRNLNNLF